MEALRVEAREGMFVFDGGPDAQLPIGSGGPVLAGPEAIFVAGRVASDASTVVRVGDPGGQGGLVSAYDGVIATPNRILRVVNVEQEVLGVVGVPGELTQVRVYLTDPDEPDEIFVALGEEAMPE